MENSARPDDLDRHRDVLDRQTYLVQLRTAVAELARHAAAAGMTAPVPTCPQWCVRDLVAHQGMVHRWATELVRDGSEAAADALEAAGREAPEPLRWFDEGAAALAGTLRDAPVDLAAPVFLRHAPEPALFWARRQAHETTVHALDAYAAALGRPPRADETWVTTEWAADGIDELLRGFLPRSTSRLRSAEPYVVAVVAEDTADVWTIEVGPEPPVTHCGGSVEPDVTLRGSAVELYLGLWNRTPVLRADGRSGFSDEWRRQVQVLW